MWALLLSAASVAGAGCVDVNGGAVEFSWSLLTFDDQPIVDNCTGARIDKVRLHWAAAPGNPSEVSGTADFPCARRRGVTGFEIENGAYSLWIEPICPNGLPAVTRTYEVPAPLIRVTTWGEVTTLGSLLIVADDSTGLDPVQLDDMDCTCCPGSFSAMAGQIDGP